MRSADAMEPPPLRRPAVVGWFQVYCGAMVLLYLVIAGLGLWALLDPDWALKVENFTAEHEVTEPSAMGRIFAAVYFGIGFVCAAAFVVGLLAPRKGWAWVFHLVLICFGLTSCCLWPATIPLLVHWIKPATKAWYRQA